MWHAQSFIDDAVSNGGRVLVHCIAGVSRSVALAAAWMMSRQRMSLKATLKRIRAQRPIARPNEHFLLALADYELELFGCSSVADRGAGEMWNFYAWNERRARVERRADEHSSVCSVQ